MDKNRKNYRLWFQTAWTVFTNGYAAGFLKGKIYTGKTKLLCVPGLNCYSCPGALGSCPIGSLQAVLGDRNYKISYYVFGILMFLGAVLGRFICGWMCPFGLVQDLLYKIKIKGMKKIKNLPGHAYLKWLKYGILALFVIILPLFAVNIVGMGSPWFCKYICPSGTLFAGIPLLAVDEGLRSAIGFLFNWKVLILVTVILLSIKSYRPFCKYLCPLGAIYGFFNPIALYHFQIDQDACTSCGACQKACGMDIPVWQKPNSMECIRCGDCRSICPHQAIQLSIKSKKKEKQS